MGSGATAGTGAGAGAAGTGGVVGAGAGAAGGGDGVTDGGSVGFPVPGSAGWVFWSPGRSPQTTPQPGPVSPLSACAGAAADTPTVSASTAIAAAATPRGAEEDRIMVTFADGARHPPRRTSVAGSLLQRTGARKSLDLRARGAGWTQSLFSGGRAICSLRALPRPTM